MFLVTLLEAVFYFFAHWCLYRFGADRNDPARKDNLFYRWVRGAEKRAEKANIAVQAAPMPWLSVPQLSVEDVNPMLFTYVTQEKTRPLVIKGLLSASEAVHTWSAEHLRECYGDTPCADGRALADILDKLGETVNVTALLSVHPKLREDLDLLGLRLVDAHQDHLDISMFLNGSSTATSLHCAVGGAFFLNVCGRKQWTLIDPLYSRYLKMTPDRQYTVVWSDYDLDDERECEELACRVPMHRVFLEPGDCLYVPAWWMTHVSSVSEFGVGCVIRDCAYSQSFYNHPMYMLQSPFWYQMNPYVLWMRQCLKNPLLRTVQQ